MSAPDAPWVLGASGQVGHFLQRRMGDAIVPCARSVPDFALKLPESWRLFDLWRSQEPPTCTQLISAGPLSGCVDWLARTGPGALQRVVALSSMSAVHKLASSSAFERNLARQLLDGEQGLLAWTKSHGIECTILRPTLIWGAGIDQSLTPFAKAAARRGVALVPSAACGLRQPVHADDLAALCIALLRRDQAATGVFEAGGSERLALSEMLARTARSMDARVLRLPVPKPLMGPLASLARQFGGASDALARAMNDQCVQDDAVWSCVGIVPRGFRPCRSDWSLPMH